MKNGNRGWALALLTVCAMGTAWGVEEGFVSLFNGRDLTGWTGNKSTYYVTAQGELACGPREGVKVLPDDWLMTEKEYADFVIRFDFQYEPGGDNGLGVRWPGIDDMAYSGVEMQLADTAQASDRKDIWRTSGGFYGVSNALDDRKPGQPVIGRTYWKPAGEWNAVELRAEGSKLTGWLNGVKVNECDLSTRDPRTGYDHHPHSGVRARKGHIVWWVGNPGKTVKWRNLRIRELKSADAVDADKRRFLYSDFMNRKLVYVDEANPDAYWEAFLPGIAFDIARGGRSRLYASQPNGWIEYDLAQRRFVREIKDPRRVSFGVGISEGADGHVYLLEEKGTVHEFTQDGQWLFDYAFPSAVRHGRSIRLTDHGTALLGIDDGVAEVKLDRNLPPEQRLVRRFLLPGAKSAYQGQYLPDGRLLATGGYLPVLATFTSDGRLVSSFKAGQTDGLTDFFYGGFTRRPNGGIMLANWTGHSGRDFVPGWKLIEFSPDGRVTWHWNAPWAGTPCAVITFD